MRSTRGAVADWTLVACAVREFEPELEPELRGVFPHHALGPLERASTHFCGRGRVDPA